VSADEKSSRRFFLYPILFTLLSTGCAVTKPKTVDVPHPIVIAHRGASGYLPDHTLEAYSLAIDLGADYIEPDLVATQDGHLIARHEPNLIATTNVASRAEFADRKRKMKVDGVEEEGFFASDFRLDEIKTLGAVQQFAERDQSMNGRFKVPTLVEIIALAKRKSTEKNRVVGIYPETKHPTYHRALGLPLEEPLVAALKDAGWHGRDAPVYIQSFEPSSLRYLRERIAVKQIQLVAASGVGADGMLEFNPPYARPYDWTVVGESRTFGDLLTVSGLKEIKSYADGIGVWKPFIVSSSTQATGAAAYNEANRKLIAPSQIIDAAHRAGLLVHAWTFRSEPHRLPSDYQGNPIAEYLKFYALGIDGVFSDFADAAVTARHIYHLKQRKN
jgi:glycerophosphoryl diester phosphodiesterase